MVRGLPGAYSWLPSPHITRGPACTQRPGSRGGRQGQAWMAAASMLQVAGEGRAHISVPQQLQDTLPAITRHRRGACSSHHKHMPWQHTPHACARTRRVRDASVCDNEAARSSAAAASRSARAFCSARSSCMLLARGGCAASDTSCLRVGGRREREGGAWACEERMVGMERLCQRQQQHTCIASDSSQQTVFCDLGPSAQPRRGVGACSKACSAGGRLSWLPS